MKRRQDRSEFVDASREFLELFALSHAELARLAITYRRPGVLLMRQKSVRNPAGALNVKLLLILSIVGMTLVGGLAGAYFFLVLRSASTIYAKGVELEQAGEFRNARRSYGRVLGKEPRELEYLTALQRVILMTSPNSSVEANEFYNAWLGSLKWGAENHPDLPERSHVLVRAIYADAMNVRSVSLMEMVEETADAAGIRNLENEAFSERWVAASRLNRIRWADLRDREREEAFELLQNRLDDNPKRLITDSHFVGTAFNLKRRYWTMTEASSWSTARPFVICSIRVLISNSLLRFRNSPSWVKLEHWSANSSCDLFLRIQLIMPRRCC